MAVRSKQRRLAHSLTVVVAFLLSAFFLSKTPVVAAEPLVRLSAGVSPAHSHGMLTGRLPGQAPVNLAITLPLRNQAELQQLLARLYNPSDPAYGQYLSREEFTKQFAPTEQQYDAVAAFARSQGLSVVPTSNRLVLDVAGPAASVEAAFSLHLNTYQSEDGHSFFAADDAPALPLSIAGLVNSVQGLDGSVCLHPNVRVLSQSDPSTGPYVEKLRDNTTGHSMSGGLTPAGIKAAYSSAPILQDGTGQNVALFELDDYTNHEVGVYISQYYPKEFNLPSITRIPVDGGPGGPSGGDGELEVALDIDMNLALAPRMRNIYVYEAPNDAAGIVDEYNRIAMDDKARVVNTSWGIWEDQFDGSHAMQDVENEIFQEMAAQGQSVYAATGDYGAYDPYSGNVSAQDPATQPWVCSVGGTQLSVKSNGSYNSETCWWNGPTGSSYTYGYGSGGGVSSYWQIPGYQSGYFSNYFNNVGQYLSTPAYADMASQQSRNVPDVSLDADPATGYDTYTDAEGYGWISAGGTSAAVQVWGAFTALVNQARAGAQAGPVGFPSFALYNIAATQAGTTALHDIAWSLNGNGYWSTGTGYDNTTGLGSFNMSVLMQQMLNQSTGYSPPLPPASVAATAGDRLISASCSPSLGATRYLWYLTPNLPGSSAQLVANTIVPSVKIKNVSNGVAYQLQVAATDSAGSSDLSDYSNTVIPQGVAIAGGPSTIVTNLRQVTIIWSTNLSANTVIQYGKTAALGFSATQSTMAQNHSISLVGLVPGTTYYYRVQSSDGITTAASTGTFKP